MTKDPMKLLEEIREIADGRRHCDDCFDALGTIRDLIDSTLDESERATWAERSRGTLNKFFDNEEAS